MLPKIEGYEVLDKIGEGGMAIVYRARHLGLDREVALKLLSKQYSQDKVFTERFLREARISAKLVHPNIVQIHDVGRSNDTLYLSMELVTGGDLKSAKHRPLSAHDILPILQSLCSALDHAHAQGYLHRDIKPANILFREDASLVLTDFGISKAIKEDSNITQTGLVLGTPSYMSPEQAQGLKLDTRSDLYSVGVLTYYYLLGQLPYESDSMMTVAIKHINEPIPILPTEFSKFQHFFDTALAKLPEERFSDGQALVQSFEEITQNTSLRISEEITRSGPIAPHNNSKAATVTLPKLTDKNRRRNTQFYSLLGLVCVFFALTLFAIFYFQTSVNQQANNELSRENKLKIAQLLTEAEMDLSSGKLVYPAGENAYEKYLSILNIAENHEAALEGINRVSDTLSELIINYINANELDKARLEIDKLRVLNPNYEKLSAIEQRFTIENAIRKDTNKPTKTSHNEPKRLFYETRTNNISENSENALSQEEIFVRSAEEALANGAVHSPDKKNAIYYYKQALALNRQNLKAKSGLKKALYMMSKEAEAFMEKENFDQAQSVISKLSILDENQNQFFQLQYKLNKLKSERN